MLFERRWRAKLRRIFFFNAMLTHDDARERDFTTHGECGRRGTSTSSTYYNFARLTTVQIAQSIKNNVPSGNNCYPYLNARIFTLVIPLPRLDPPSDRVLGFAIVSAGASTELANDRPADLREV